MTATKANTPTLRSIVDRIGRLEDEKQQIADDIKEIYAEAKSNGFNVKALRKVIRDQRRPPDAEVEALVETYKHKLGMLADTPLGKAAANREFGDTKVVIEAGGHKIETTTGGIQQAADYASTPRGRRKIRELAAEMPPPAKLPDADTAVVPFHPPPDAEPRVAEPN